MVVGFSRVLRAAGLPVTPGRMQACVEALDTLDAGARHDVYWAGRLTLCANHEDLDRYDRAFVAYFAGDAPHRRLSSHPREQQRLVPLSVQAPLRQPGEDQTDDEPLDAHLASASGVERLRTRDIAELTPADRELLARLLAAFSLQGVLRPGRRRRRARSGAVDARRTIRAALAGGGEPIRLHRHRAHPRPRSVVLLLDVSGSMGSYADALLRFAHVSNHVSNQGGGAGTEVFTMGTRLTRVSRELAHRDPDSAMAAAAGAIPDWSGGTRLGDNLKAFLDGWGQRGMARGAVVVVLSDGWERGEPDVLAEQMARLHRLAHRVVWANPRMGRSGYQPLARGMAAALPYVDDFVPGHSLAALERLARVVTGAERALAPQRGLSP